MHFSLISAPGLVVEVVIDILFLVCKTACLCRSLSVKAFIFRLLLLSSDMVSLNVLSYSERCIKMHLSNSYV